jgi:hypothetical protein
MAAASEIDEDVGNDRGMKILPRDRGGRVLVVVAVVLVVLWKPVVLMPLLLPGVALLPLLGILPSSVPTSLAYFVAPEGGPVAAVGVIVLGAVLFWAAVLCVWAWRR